MITYGKFNLSNYADCLIVTDEKIANLYNISGSNVYLLPRGEAAKTFEHAQNLCRWFLQQNLGKDGKVVAVGGGSIGDTVGFACSIYKRGVSLLHVPTTLIAQIDSSIGGKTALDIDDTKNVVGSFYQADTLIDVSFLGTLSKKRYFDGLGELLKYRMLSPAIDKLAHSNNMESIIRGCVTYKDELCQRDFTDQGPRNVLNFGHTIGHAMELSLGITHGHAVALGIYYEIVIAHKLGLCTKQYVDKWQREITNLFDILPMNNKMMQIMQQDKKNKDGKIAFILPTSFQPVYLTQQKIIDLLDD